MWQAYRGGLGDGGSQGVVGFKRVVRCPAWWSLGGGGDLRFRFIQWSSSLLVLLWNIIRGSELTF